MDNSDDISSIHNKACLLFQKPRPPSAAVHSRTYSETSLVPSDPVDPSSETWGRPCAGLRQQKRRQQQQQQRPARTGGCDWGRPCAGSRVGRVCVLQRGHARVVAVAVAGHFADAPRSLAPLLFLTPSSHVVLPTSLARAVEAVPRHPFAALRNPFAPRLVGTGCSSRCERVLRRPSQRGGPAASQFGCTRPRASLLSYHPFHPLSFLFFCNLY